MGHKSNKELAERVASLPAPPNRWPRWVVSGGGVGFLRPAPGSWGTIPPAIIFALMLYYGVSDPWRSVVLLIFGAIAGVLLVAYGKWAAAYYREPDPGTVILDEYAGFAVTVAFLPIHPSHFPTFWPMFALVSALYVLFRATDTLKLPPANYLERLPWGWGVLLDDLAAGLQANLVAQIVLRLWFS